MGDKISGYIADAVSNPIAKEDLLDLSSYAGGLAYDVSKKITVQEMMDYINTEIDSYYNVDGTLASKRLVTMNGQSSTWENGNIISKSGLNDNGYLLSNSLDVVRGEFKYDVGLDSASLNLDDAVGTFFSSIDRQTNVNGLFGLNKTTPTYEFDMVGSVRCQGKAQFGATSSFQGNNGITVDNGGSSSFDFLTLSNSGIVHAKIGRGGHSGFGETTDPGSFMRVRSEGGTGNYRNGLLLEQTIASTGVVKSIGMKVVNNSVTAIGSEPNVGVQYNVTGHLDGVEANFAIDILAGLIRVDGMPTSSVGLPVGTIWSNLGVLNIT